MMHNDPFNNNQFVLSYELLYLLQWLIEHESKTIKKMINRAVRKGFKDSLIDNNDVIELEVTDTMQQSIIEFFGLMDCLLQEAINEDKIKKVLQRNLIPAINHIDSTICDDETVQFSLEKASTKIEHHPEENPEELLFKELLKCWKPAKKNTLN